MNLRDWRRAQGKSVDEVAADLAVSTDTIYRWEQGKLIPRRAAMARIGALTNGDVGPADFFGTATQAA